MARQSDTPSIEPWASGAAQSGDFVDILIRDADFALVTWRVGAESAHARRVEMERHWPGAALTLRLRVVGRRDGALSEQRALDVAIDRWSGSLLVPLGESGAPHVAAVGLKGPARAGGAEAFVAIARSAPAQPPRSQPAPPAPVVWAEASAVGVDRGARVGLDDVVVTSSADEPRT